MISIKKKPTSYSFKNLFYIPKLSENSEIKTNIFEKNSFKLKQNKSINNLMNIQQSSLITVGKNILNSHSIFSSHQINKNKPKLELNRITKRENPINYDLINSCKLAIYNSRKNLKFQRNIY